MDRASCNTVDSMPSDDVTCTNEDFYVIEIDGPAPQLWIGVAFRKIKRSNVTEILKEIKCPHCEKPFFKVSARLKLEIKRHSTKKHVSYHELKNCKHCFEKVGIRYIAG